MMMMMMMMNVFVCVWKTAAELVLKWSLLSMSSHFQCRWFFWFLYSL